MNESLMAYIERLETMAFFVGYPIVYAGVHVIAGMQKKNKQPTFFYKLIKLLPFAYALSGTLFVGFVLRNLYPDYSIKNIADQFQYPYLKIVGLLALLFWIPFFAKRPFLGLLHSLIFFFFLLKDLFIHFTSNSEIEIIKTDMKIYTDSMILNTGTLIAIALLFYLFSKIINHKCDNLID